MKIAVDGPAVSGKSSAAKRLAAALGFLYLDSGALYRTVTLATTRGLELSARDLPARLSAAGIRLARDPQKPGCRVFLGAEDVSERIRAEDIAKAVSAVAATPAVREWVTGYLRSLSGGNDVVMDGRDIGTVVFPDAECKFFVTASLEARTRRRLADLGGADQALKAEEIREHLRQRDENDRNRALAPLAQAPDAILVDNSELSLEATVERMLTVVNERRMRV